MSRLTLPEPERLGRTINESFETDGVVFDLNIKRVSEGEL